MVKKIVKFFCDKLVNWCERTGRVFYITGGANRKTVYLVRYIVFKSRFGCIFIHRFLRSDADDPHDHPWNFFTYILDGEYTEMYYKHRRAKTAAAYNLNNVVFWDETKNRRKPGSLAFRRATDIHKVVVDKQLQLNYTPGKQSAEDKAVIEQAPYTLCVMFNRVREWGFWSQDGSQFTDWKRYLNIVPGDQRIAGGE